MHIDTHIYIYVYAKSEREAMVNTPYKGMMLGLLMKALWCFISGVLAMVHMSLLDSRFLLGLSLVSVTSGSTPSGVSVLFGTNFL